MSVEDKRRRLAAWRSWIAISMATAMLVMSIDALREGRARIDERTTKPLPASASDRLGRWCRRRFDWLMAIRDRNTSRQFSGNDALSCIAIGLAFLAFIASASTSKFDKAWRIEQREAAERQVQSLDQARIEQQEYAEQQARLLEQGRDEQQEYAERQAQLLKQIRDELRARSAP